MSEPKFTPGPWNCKGVHQDGCAVYVDVGTEPGLGDVAVLYRMGRHDEQLLANARLIAAAPDLYAALRELRNAWCLNACDAASPDEGLNHLPECYAARDALEKAVAP
jgi:hypothetical protein